MSILLEIMLLVTTVLVALIAGLFYSYSCSVNPGLARLPDREYLGAMQSINRAILNPLFFLSFLGSRGIATTRSAQCSTWQRSSA